MLRDRLVPALGAVRQQVCEGDPRVAELGIRRNRPAVDADGSFHVLEGAREKPSELVQRRRDAEGFTLGMRLHEAGEQIGGLAPLTEAAQQTRAGKSALFTGALDSRGLAVEGGSLAPITPPLQRSRPNQGDSRALGLVSDLSERAFGEVESLGVPSLRPEQIHQEQPSPRALWIHRGGLAEQDLGGLFASLSPQLELASADQAPGPLLAVARPSCPGLECVHRIIDPREVLENRDPAGVRPIETLVELDGLGVALQRGLGVLCLEARRDQAEVAGPIRVGRVEGEALLQCPPCAL